MIPELIKFLKENKDLINENTKKSWEEIYKKLESKGSIGEFTNTILKAEINDPAEILGYIPKYYLYKSNIQDYKIPDNVKNIGDYAFYDCNNLVSVKIGDNVTTIGQGAFRYCINLTSITIPDSVTSIGDNTFYYCPSLTSVVIGNGVTTIGYRAFCYCDSLTSVVIGNGVTSIGNYAFDGCSGLTSVEISDSVTEIGYEAFSGCYSLKKINFNGTKEQAIQLGIGNRLENEWGENSAVEKIICSDGVIEFLNA